MNYKKYTKYKESGIAWLGEIPEEWEVKREKEIEKFDGSTVDKKTKETKNLLREIVE